MYIILDFFPRQTKGAKGRDKTKLALVTAEVSKTPMSRSIWLPKRDGCGDPRMYKSSCHVDPESKSHWLNWPRTLSIDD